MEYIPNYTRTVLTGTLLSCLLLGCSAPAPQKSTNASAAAAGQTTSSYDQFAGYNPELTTAARRAVKLSRPAIAENLFLAQYERTPNPAALYQIFLVYIDSHNSARDSDKAHFYLDKLNKEWPQAEETGKANRAFSGQ